MAKRKIRILDKKFQLRTIFSITGIMLISFFVIIVISSYNAMNSNAMIKEAMTKLNRTIETEDNIVHTLIKNSRRTGNGKFRISIKDISNDHMKSIEVMKEHLAFLKGRINSSYNLLIIISTFSLIVIIITYFFILRLTHRISGPVYVIKNRIQDLIDGIKPDFRELRAKDELNDLYEKVKELAEKIN
ncbi:hypothetical protein ACFL20_03385 [Spirochaetota bacterium]